MKYLALLVLTLAMPLFAANSTPVTDATALELVFLTSCAVPELHTAKDEMTVRSHALHKYQLSDENGVRGLLNSFCVRYQKAIDKQHKDSDKEIADAVAVKHDFVISSDPEFKLYLNAMVQDTADKLKAKYPNEWTNFMAIVQAEKPHMAVLDEGPAMMAGVSHHHGQDFFNAQTPTDTFPNQYGYVGYVNFSTNGYSAGVTAAITGSSQNSLYCTWNAYKQQWEPVGSGCPSVQHIPTINLVMTGGAPNPYNFSITNTGTSLTPVQYMNYSQSIWDSAGWNFFGPSDPSITVTGTVQLFCSVAKAIIVSWPISFQLMDTYTKCVVAPDCSSVNWCLALYSPPAATCKKLIPLTVGACNQPYWDVYTTWISHGHQPWVVLGPSAALSAGVDSSMGKCDKKQDMRAP